ncbi:MAG: T9SS type A sorting domain-containing protein [Crocinitomicaceae bacterium]|nr:T9SS type A sorting domain-containing protein [Crocinitomicaceae bacterium]
MKQILLGIILCSSATVFGQYCLTGGPSNINDSNLELLSLTGTSGGINYTGCPGVLGVEEFLSQTTTLDAGAAYVMTVQFGTCGGNYGSVAEVWIDFNQNNIFEASESILTWAGTPPMVAGNYVLSVPAGAVSGQTRMRVVQAEGQAAPLDPCVAFTWGSVTDFVVEIINGTGSPTACTAGPTQQGDSNIEALNISGTSGSSISYTGCPGVIGLETYTAETVTLGLGNNFVLDVQFGTCGGNYAGAGEAWIDYNQNFVYEASESIGTWAGVPPTTLSSFNFQVPMGATLGATTMRVIQQEGGVLPLDPCATFTWGAAIDFNVTIEQGVDCSAYQGDVMSDAIVVASLPYVDNSSTSVCYTNQNQVYSSPDVYYQVTTDPLNPLMTISLCGSSFDTFLSIAEPNGTVISGNDDGATCAPQSEVTFSTANYPVVYVIVEGWGLASGDYTISINEQPLGLNDVTLEGINIYPNPTASIFQLDNETSGSVIITDMKGAVVLTTEVEPNETISVENLNTGIYLVRFTTGEHQVIKKLIKE